MENTGKRKKQVGMNLTEGPILSALLIFAVPIVLTNLIQQLYSMVDLMIIGRFVGSTGTVGVATGGELSDIMTPIANSFATAGQIYIAQLAGAREHTKIKEAAGTLITMMMVLSLVFMFGAILFSKWILQLLNCPDEAFSQASSYMVITALGMPFIFGYNAVCALLRGIGESRRPLLFVSVAATVNIFLDLLLVAGLHMEADGTAIATVASQIGAFLAAFLFMYHRKEQFDFQLNTSYFKIRKDALKIILTLGIPQLIRSLSVNFSMLWVKANINYYGLVASATYSVGNKIEKFMNVFIQGVDGAAGAMIGQNLGARKPERVTKTLWTTVCCTLVFGIFNAALFLLFPKELFHLFTSDPAVMDYGVTFLRIMSVACIVVALAGPFKAIATGAGAAALCFVIGVLDGVCRIGVCLFFVYVIHYGADSYFWGAALCQLIPGCICLAYFISGRWKTRKLLSEQ